MIPARRHELFNLWFTKAVESRLARMFSAVRICGVESVRAALTRGSIVVVANHTAWWDPMFPIYFFTRVVRGTGYCLMDAKNLHTHPFLGRVGGFGVDLADPADGARGIRWAAKRLRGPGKIVFVFPQGTQRPLSEPRLDFRTGAAAIARVAKCEQIFPLALRYEFGEDERPVLWASFGPSFAFEHDVAANAAKQAAAVTAELGRIDRAICLGESLEAFPVLLHRPAPLLGRLLERLLAWFTRRASRPAGAD